MDVRPLFSLVIPARNEAEYLPGLLDSVEVARANYRAGGERVEVIVADNASTDETAEMARARGCRVVRVEKRVIGAVRNAGGRAAKGDYLAFIDADSRIHPRTFDVLETCLADTRVVGGATGVKMERVSLGIAATYAVLIAVAWTTRMDTGVVFCRRKDFDAAGGYREDVLFTEDVHFLWALKRLGRSRGQRLARATRVKAFTSTRKFDDHGDWHYLANFVRSGYWYFFDPARLEEWGRDYWYRARD